MPNLKWDPHIKKKVGVYKSLVFIFLLWKKLYDCHLKNKLKCRYGIKCPKKIKDMFYPASELKYEYINVVT